MKFFTRTLLSLSLFILTNLAGKSQVLTENFNSGLPATWTQSPTATWSLNPTLGTSGSSCIFTEDAGSMSLTTTIYTPTLNLASVTNFTISFKAALVANNFVGPNIAVSYDAGNGPQFIARWGSGFTSNTTYTLLYSSDYQPPLDAQNASLTACSHTFASVNGNTAKFIFDAEFVNGGYTVIEDIVISGVTTITTGLEEKEIKTDFVIFPNPTTTKKITVEGKDIKTIEITDNLGKKFPAVYSKLNDTAFELDFNKFATGIYFVTAVTEENKLICKKIVLE